MKARAFHVTGPAFGELLEVEVSEPEGGEVHVRTLHSGISRGTETLVFGNEVPVSEHERMRAPFQSGDFPFPVKYGYCSVGRVEIGPPELLGRDVFCLYPHQERYTVPASAVTPLPEDVPPARAVLTANLETAVNALWDAGPRIGDRIAVVGAGVVGCLTAWLCGRLPGARVTLVDVNPARATVADALGVGFASPDASVEGIAGEADLVVHASGSGAGLGTSIALAGFEATVLELSWYGTREVLAPLGGAFHSKRLSLRASQVGHVAAARRARRDHAARLGLALELLRESTLDALVTHTSDFADLPGTLSRLARGGDDLCHRVDYPSST